jgi:hypothetical protein
MRKTQNAENSIILYHTADGKVKIDMHMEGKTLWRNQAQMAQLFERERSVITKHIGNIFSEGELVCKNLSLTRNSNLYKQA